MKILTACVAVAALLGADGARTDPDDDMDMNLGAFSISLTVNDLAASRAFYEQLGFEVIGGSPEQDYQILRNGESTIGLFHGMFEKNILTFNPGWNSNAQKLPSFTDVREIQRQLKVGLAAVPGV